MRIALDSSALAKRYVHEQGTPRVLKLCANASEVLVSVLCVPEIISGLNRLRREEKLSWDDYVATKRDLAADVAQATVVQLTPSVVSLAIDILEKSPLRAQDALHIAAALGAECDLFVSADVQQCKAAAKLGWKVERIG